MAGINFKAFDLGGHEIARRVWKDYYAKVNSMLPADMSLSCFIIRKQAVHCLLSAARICKP